MRYSVVIPTYNRAHSLEKSIASVLAQQRDEGDTCEVIVVDDGSTDDTSGVARQFKNDISYHWQPNRGVSAARNRGIHLATGDWVAFLDSDDEWTEACLPAHTEAIRKYPDITGSVLASVAVALDGEETDHFQEHGLLDVFETATSIHRVQPLETVTRHHITTLQSCAFRRDSLVKTRLFDETLPIAEDFDLIAQVALTGAFAFSRAVGARVIRRREDVTNLSALFHNDAIKARLCWTKVYDRLLHTNDLTRREKTAIRQRHAANLRALGNLHLLNRRRKDARAAYWQAVLLDWSGRSLGRFAQSHLPTVTRVQGVFPI